MESFTSESQANLLPGDASTPRWHPRNGASSSRRNSRCRTSFIILSLLICIIGSAVVFLHLLSLVATPVWPVHIENSNFGHSGGNSNQNAGNGQESAEAGNGDITPKDLVILLNPQDHVFREAKERHFSFNITQSTIAPDGVLKPVYHINGK